MELRLRSGIRTGRTSVRHRRDLRRGARRFRTRMAGVPVETHRVRFSGMARSERLDRAKICAVGYRQSDLNRQLWTGETAHRFRKCACGEIFDMHGPEACWCMRLTSRRPNTPKKKAVESSVTCSRHNIASSSGPLHHVSLWADRNNYPALRLVEHGEPRSPHEATCRSIASCSWRGALVCPSPTENLET
jgi:hypothetical protein